MQPYSHWRLLINSLFNDKTLAKHSSHRITYSHSILNMHKHTIYFHSSPRRINIKDHQQGLKCQGCCSITRRTFHKRRRKERLGKTSSKNTLIYFLPRWDFSPSGLGSRSQLLQKKDTSLLVSTRDQRHAPTGWAFHGVRRLFLSNYEIFYFFSLKFHFLG